MAIEDIVQKSEKSLEIRTAKELGNAFRDNYDDELYVLMKKNQSSTCRPTSNEQLLFLTREDKILI